MSPIQRKRLRRYLHEAVWIAVIAVICGAMTLIVAFDTFRKTSSLTTLHEEALQTSRSMQTLDEILLAQSTGQAAAVSYRVTGNPLFKTAYEAAHASFETQFDNLPANGDESLQALRHDLMERELSLDRTDPVLDSAVRTASDTVRRAARQRLQQQSTQAAAVQHMARTQLSIAVALAFLCIMAAIVSGHLQRDHRRRMVRKLQWERLNAIAANRTKSSFLAYTSHELRTPLNAIIGFSEFMMMEHAGPLSDRQKQYLGDIRGSGVHLQALISDILDLTKAEAGKIVLNRRKLDIGELVTSCLKLIEGQANEAGVNLHVDLAPGLPTLDGDELRCKQVLINICGNAIQFTPAGGDVRLSVAPSPGGGLIFTITDTGTGISAEDLPKVIQPYYRSGIDEPSHKGYGLGLPLACKIVELHGGSLAIASELGRGTAVTICFPQTGTIADNPAAPVPERSGDILSFRRKKV